jgi:hypothetical protein
VLEVTENTGDFVWLGGRESLPQFSETPAKTGVFSTTRMMLANWCFRVLSLAPVCFLLFSDSASAMTLEMTLAPNVSRVRLVGNPRLQNPMSAGTPTAREWFQSASFLRQGEGDDLVIGDRRSREPAAGAHHGDELPAIGSKVGERRRFNR